jgi:hypothetical protein
MQFLERWWLHRPSRPICCPCQAMSKARYLQRNTLLHSMTDYSLFVAWEQVDMRLVPGEQLRCWLRERVATAQEAQASAVPPLLLALLENAVCET